MRAAGLLVLLGLCGGAAHAQVVTEFTAGISPNTDLSNITAGPDGNLWFTEQFGSRIGRITPLGVVTEFSAAGGPFGITAGPDGNLWFTESYGNRIGRITPLGIITEFGSGITQPQSITAAPDGNLWFTETSYDNPPVSRIGRVTPLGVLTEFGAGISAGTRAASITAGPDGNLWFIEYPGNRIGRITPLGVVTEFGAGISTNAGLSTIVSGSDGNLWFTEVSANRIGRITPSGVVTEFSAGTSALAAPGAITSGSDGNLWFADQAGSIERITPSGVVTEFSVELTAFLYPITAGPDGNLWFMEGESCIPGGPDGGGCFGGTNEIGRMTTGPAPTAASFHTTPPCRVLDTRLPPGPLGGPALVAGGGRSFVVSGTCGIPTGAISISANVTVTGATSAGALYVSPASLALLNFQAGATRANNAVLLLSTDGTGTLSFSNDLSSGSVQVIVDVNGWWQ